MTYYRRLLYYLINPYNIWKHIKWLGSTSLNTEVNPNCIENEPEVSGFQIPQGLSEGERKAYILNGSIVAAQTLERWQKDMDEQSTNHITQASFMIAIWSVIMALCISTGMSVIHFIAGFIFLLMIGKWIDDDENFKRWLLGPGLGDRP